jgi:hypothetical protein
MEDKKKDIWNFSLIHKNQENDKVGFNFLKTFELFWTMLIM